MTKSSVTAEEKERLRREEMERLRNNFLNIRPDNDKALENDLRRQTPVPLSHHDLVLKESAEVLAPAEASPETARINLPDQDPQEQETLGIGAEGRGGETAKALKPRFPTASVASPTAEVLFKELAPQIRAFRTTEPARRITVSVSEEVFSRVSHLHFVERVGKLEIMSFLMERYVPRDRPEKLPRFLPPNTQNMPVFRSISPAKGTGENGLIGIEWRQSTGLSLEGTSAVRFQRLYRANATRSQTDVVAKVP